MKNLEELKRKKWISVAVTIAIAVMSACWAAADFIHAIEYEEHRTFHAVMGVVWTVLSTLYIGLGFKTWVDHYCEENCGENL